MSSSARFERLNELLAERALVGLAPSEEAELTSLLHEFPDTDVEAFERTAATIALAAVPFEPMPASLTARLHQQVAQPSQSTRAPMSVPPSAPLPKRVSRGWATAGWIAAAACLVLFLGSIAWRRREPPVPTAAAERAKLLETKKPLRLDWSATKDPAAKAAQGDVVWDATEQRGYMRFRGLAKNDKQTSQYQLWIFDAKRDSNYPVDGGVFDIDSETGDVVVAIKAKLPVTEPVLFAVTVEAPGGVVVSKRERIVVTAKPGAG